MIISLFAFLYEIIVKLLDTFVLAAEICYAVYRVFYIRFQPQKKTVQIRVLLVKISSSSSCFVLCN